jgi:hypothetical protein
LIAPLGAYPLPYVDDADAAPPLLAAATLIELPDDLIVKSTDEVLWAN